MRPGATPSYLRTILSITSILLLTVALQAQNQTLGLLDFEQGAASPGYSLFAPNQSTETYLIDMFGRVVNSWSSGVTPGMLAYLLEDGTLVRAGNGAAGIGAGGLIEKYDWDGHLLWQYDYAELDHLQHHDIEPLPNGNVLLLAWEYRTEAEAIAAGRNPALISNGELWLEHIVEVRQDGSGSGEIIWEWHVWDHLVQDFDSTKANYGVVAEHPELIDLNFPGTSQSDWIHANAIEYNPDLDQVVFSAHQFSELWVIDHSTSTAESASHSGGDRGKGGDLLYRWGNPQAYDAGDANDQQLFNQHDTQWIKPGLPGAGNLLIFNNGVARPSGKYSSIVEIQSPVDVNGNYPALTPGQAYGPAAPVWTYVAAVPTDFYAASMSGVQRLKNGNTLICHAPQGRFFEVTPAGEKVWEYRNPVNSWGPLEQGSFPWGTGTFRCNRYAADYAGLENEDLTPGTQLETYPIMVAAAKHEPVQPTSADSVVVSATVETDNVLTSVLLYADLGEGFVSMPMFDDGNHHDSLAHDRLYAAVLPPAAPETIVRYYLTTADNIGSSVADPPLAPEVTYRYLVAPAEYLCGDADGNEIVNITDAVFLINYIFNSGPPPDPELSGDTNCDGVANVTDAVYLIQYIFSSGPAPCAGCP
ncbi:MAG: aryl-sulfate sulfotransferase [bacterium]